VLKKIANKLEILPIALLLGLFLATSSQIAAAQEYKKLMRLGTSEAVCRGGVETAADLQAFFANNPNAIRAILADSGWAGNADDLLAAVENGELIERAYPVGTQMAWMGAKVKDGYKARPYREWAGSKSFEAFQVNVSSGCQVYHIAIPKACCNVSLIGVAPDESSECVAPVAAIGSEPVAEPVVAEASSNKAKLGLIPFIGVFAGSETRARFEPSWNEDMKDSSGIAGVRAGLMKAISDKTSVFAQASYYDRSSINDGNIYPEDNLAIDIGLDRKLSEHAFIGGGIGIWNIDDSDFRDATLFGHVGGDIGASNFQWILEGRVFDSDSDNHDSISDNKMFSLGIRYLIK
jgi:hypothetical protein